VFRLQLKHVVVLLFVLVAAAGTVEDRDAGGVQRATELPAEDLRVHGAHTPHPQGLQPVGLHRPHAGEHNPRFRSRPLLTKRRFVLL